MKKNLEERVCAKCGNTVDGSASACSVCGEVVVSSVENRKPGVGNTFFSVLLSLLLFVFTVLFVLLLFIHALNENVLIPDVGPISRDWLAMFFDSWYALALGGTLVLIPLLIIVLINTHRIRRIFLFVGMSSILSCLFSIALAFIGTHMVKLFSGEWQDALINSTNVFKDFCVVCAVILAVLGTTSLSIYSCIKTIKGAKHEKET